MNISEVILGAILCILVLPLVAIVAVEFFRFLGVTIYGIGEGLAEMWKSGKRYNFHKSADRDRLADSNKDSNSKG